MTRFRQRPWYHLTQHFFAGLFDLGFLSEAAADSFTRMIVGCCTAFLAFGLLLTRIFIAHHGALRSPELFRLTILANQTFLIALPMWIVAFVTVLVGHALFPDETDFRVLMALPVPRRVIFGAKLLALAMFTLIFVLAAHAALLPLSLLMSMGIFVGVHWPIQFAAYFVASLLASAFAVMAVTAVQGVLILMAPRGRLLAASAALRSLMLCALVIALPLVLGLPGQARAFAFAGPGLFAAPPVWFLGLERWLLGDVSRAYFAPMTRIAGVAVAVAGALAAGSYVFLYRRFDRVLVAPVHGSPRTDRRLAWLRRSHTSVPRPVFVAIRRFTVLTLRRSALHQGILVALSAAGAGLVVNSMLGANQRELVTAVIWAPFSLMFVSSLAVRMALAVPIEQRANWIFRMTEQDGARPDQLDAALHTVRRVGVFAPLLVIAPVSWLVLGTDAIAVLLVALLCGCLLVEILMKRWTRIPFTCSYIPGKGFVPQSILIGFTSFVVFTTIGAGLAWGNRPVRSASLTIDVVLCAAVLVMRWRRLQNWTETPLDFEDQLPTEVNPLRLSPD